MKPLFALPLIALLAACGADGEPVRPTVDTTIGINSNGDTWTSISASSGNVSVSVGL